MHFATVVVLQKHFKQDGAQEQEAGLPFIPYRCEMLIEF